MDREEKTIEREATSQGDHWRNVHHGYFADPEIARPLVDAIAAAMADSQPDVVADLGGGTGFVLSELLGRDCCSGARLVDVDLSDRQLAQCCDSRIEDLQCSITQVQRDQLVGAGETLLLTMRSVLHYLGCEGTRRLLRYLREQMHTGEYFVHQTACFWNGPQRTCFNLLYQRMQTGKWYPLVGELEWLLDRTGWEVTAVDTAPPIQLDSADLAERYQLSDEQVLEIRDELGQQFHHLHGVFRPERDGFVAWLHYHVMTCRAV